MSLIIRSSAIHAAGCYTTASIANGARVVEYTGRLITKEVADARYENSIVTYLFGIGDGSHVIDGHGAAMFINHSCDPNCETDEIDGRVWVKAIRNIAAGEELTYDYNLYDGDDDEALCNCGAGTCRQTMYSVDEIVKRKRAAARAQKKALNGKTTLQRKLTNPEVRERSNGAVSAAGSRFAAERARRNAVDKANSTSRNRKRGSAR
jgi:uncharacterized protein